MKLVPLHRALAHDGCHAAERVLRSHRLIEQAARELDNGDAGSGVRSLCFAASTHLALTIGADRAGDFFEMLARVAREVGKDTEPDEAA